LVFSNSDLSALTAVLLGTAMVVYQTGLWTLARFGAFRSVILGLFGISFLTVAFLPTFPQSSDAAARSLEVLWIERAAGFALVSFLVAWIYVARLRSGGGRRRSLHEIQVGSLADVLPSRRKPFASPAEAQFWFEWRRSGSVLPTLIGTLLVA